MRVVLRLAALGWAVAASTPALAAGPFVAPAGLDRLLTLSRSDADPLGHDPRADRISDRALRLRFASAPRALDSGSWLGRWGPTLGLSAALAVSEFLVEPPRDARWSGSNAFDEAIGGALGGGSRHTRDAAATASDALLGGMLTFLVVDWYGLRDEYGLGDSVRGELPWLLGNQLATQTLKLSTARERPYVAPCLADPRYISGCDVSRDANTSFYSGHASNAAAIAGLLCARHLNRATRSTADVFACGTGVAGALATGVMRITADAHYASDVLMGWASGALFGYVLPTRTRFSPEGEPQALSGLAPLVGTRFFGFRYDIRF